MRDILFRAKRKDNGEWVEGQYYKQTHYYGDPSVKHYMIVSTEDLGYDQVFEYYEIIPETIGQFTGLRDKNGKMIFEGDIVKAKVIENKWSSTKKYTDVYEVAYHPNYCYHYLKKNGNNLLFDGNWSYGVTIEEVIGNIHDNPEYLEVR